MNIFIFGLLVLILGIAGCTKNSTTKSPSPNHLGDRSGKDVLVIAPVKFAENSEVRDAVRVECQLLTKLPEFIKRAAQSQYTTIDLQESKAKNADILIIEIVDLPQFKKNIWLGRGGQWLDIKGSLSRPGQKMVSFTAMRTSMGGFMGAFKGTCVLLGRCTKTLGADVAGWLKNPLDKARLGDQ